MVKIHILGAPGSGKTTLARNLSVTLQIPYYELDQITRKNESKIAASLNDAVIISETSEWITEGIYLFWTDPLLYQADIIVLLDVCWPIAIWRILRRHVIKTLYGMNPYPDIKSLLKLVFFTYNYCVCRKNAAFCIAETCLEEEDLEHIKTPDKKSLLTCIKKYKSDIPPTSKFMYAYLQKYRKKILYIKQDKLSHRLR